jgi:predicted kinase
MKVLIFGNIAAGKSYLAQKIKETMPAFEYLSIDDFRRKIGDGTMEKEKLAKQTFLDSILPDKLQLIEATGLGDTGESIAEILCNSTETKMVIVLKTELEICLQRLKNRMWNVPYPAPPEQALKLAEITDELLKANTIQLIWADVVNCHFFELEYINENNINFIINKIKNHNNETN